MNREEIKARYRRDEAVLQAQIGRHRSLWRGFVAGEVTAFVAAVGMVVVYTLLPGATWPLWVAAMLAVAYLAIRHLDSRNDRQTDLLEARLAVCRRELAYMDGDFTAFDDGARYADAAHPFTFDLDVFGRMSLYQRLCRTVTVGGSDRLAQRLSSLDHDTQRPRAVDELSKREQFLADFKAVGASRRIDTGAVTAALHAARQLQVPRRFTSPLSQAVVVLSVGGLWTSAVLSAFSLCSGNLPLWWAVAQFFACLLACSSFMKRLNGIVARLLSEVDALLRLVRLVRKEEFLSPYNQHVHSQLTGALESFDALDGILRRLDRRNNVLGLLLVNGLAASDFFTIRRFHQWQQRYQRRFDLWVEAVSEMDTLVSMATFCRNEPAARWADVREEPGVTVEARGLVHPFLGTRGVSNDFRIADGHFYLVTGANMAGKSTFLRTVGLSYVMAMAGLPVFAESLTASRFRLFTSMRTSDDLSHGISYFNAELLRLRQLLDAVDGKGCMPADGDLPTLIILDEILKGTNSLDKLNGSRLFLEHVAKRNATGIVATHDLELSRMAEQRPDRFHNFCFEIELGADVTYTYRITPGVARNQNATFLLKRMLDEDTKKAGLQPATMAGLKSR